MDEGKKVRYARLTRIVTNKDKARAKSDEEKDKTKEVKTEVIARKNPHSDSKVLVRAEKAYSTSIYNRNTYEVDGEETDGKNLSPIERGHVYLVEEIKVKDKAIFHIESVRICDKETVTILLAGLKSLRNRDLNLLANPKALSWAHNPKVIDFYFSLQSEDYNIFIKRLESLGGTIILKMISTKLFKDMHKELCEAVGYHVALSVELRSDIDDLSSTSNMDHFDHVLQKVDSLRELQFSIFDLIRQMGDMEQISKSRDPSSSTTTFFSTTMAANKDLVSVVRQVRVDALQNEVKKRMEKGFEGQNLLIAEKFPLRYFVDSLKKSYPVLRHIQVQSNSEVEIKLAEGSLIVRESVVTLHVKTTKDLDRLITGLHIDSQYDGPEIDPRFDGISE